MIYARSAMSDLDSGSVDGNCRSALRGRRRVQINMMAVRVREWPSRASLDGQPMAAVPTCVSQGRGIVDSHAFRATEVAYYVGL